MYNIPTSVEVGEQSYHIRNDGDFRMVIDCFLALTDTELTKQEQVQTAMIIFYDGMETPQDLYQFSDMQEAFKQMCIFFNCGREEVLGKTISRKVIDWKLDEQIICSAINKVAGKEIRQEPYLHWWTFMGYYMAVGNSTLATVVNIRIKLSKGKKLEKWENEFRKNNPEYFSFDTKQNTNDAQEAEELFKQMWNIKED